MLDGAVYGYDNMFWQSHKEREEDLSNKKLKKLDIKQIKVKNLAEYSVDYDGKKVNCDFVDENHIVSDHGKAISWNNVKRNGITWPRKGNDIEMKIHFL